MNHTLLRGVRSGIGRVGSSIELACIRKARPGAATGSTHRRITGHAGARRAAAEPAHSPAAARAAASPTGAAASVRMIEREPLGFGTRCKPKQNHHR